jgi:hypothetical protein
MSKYRHNQLMVISGILRQYGKDKIHGLINYKDTKTKCRHLKIYL